MENMHPWRHRIVFGARTRVLASFVLLIVFSTVFSLITIRQILIVRLENRIEEELFQEVEEFRRLVKGKNPHTGQPFGDNVAAIFDLFLERNVPNDDEFFLTLLDGKFYKSSHIAIPDSLYSQSERIRIWREMTQAKWGEMQTSAGKLRYLAEPVLTEGKNRGAFIVAHFPLNEYEEVNHTVAIMGVVQGIMVAIALITSLVWLASVRILFRLRLLTETARTITFSDFNRRIPVTGQDEIAELTLTFNQMLDRLQAAFNSQKNFINDAGHELRTPITIIRCYLEQIKADCCDQQEAITLIKDEFNRIERFVDDLLLLVKAERPDFLNLEIVNISSLTEELYAKVSVLAPRHWCLETIGSGRIVGDRQRLTQAVINLTQNAIQYTKEGDLIVLGSSIIDGNFRFWVQDTGEGIPRADQERIFQRFARGSTGRRSEGAGLGLAIVKAIVEAHKGTLELVSQVGIGSTFTIIIPLDPSKKEISTLLP